MNQHILQGRSVDEVLWFRRRSVLRAAAAWTATGGFAGALAQQRSNVVELRGDVLLNGRPMRPQQFVQTGDALETGPDAHIVFVIGNAAFQLRQNTRMAVERGVTLNTVSLLRLLTGAVAAVWGKGTTRQIVTPTLTAGIRGTGTYLEVRPQEDLRTYFCNCYGVIDMAAGRERVVSESEYHQSFWGEPAPVNGRLLTPARAINHTDEEMEFLAQLVGQRTPWQVAGRRGDHDGSGYMEPQPGRTHPAAR
ncbi:iron dicitrate transport regulator FecR [Ramlibacter sp. AN1133]|uniref:iron dicitrate transport regulator FecR n=1 Tax=Ramlibacter sp. AN1133 TaxID=3133429 RepID=UPI0030C2E4BA